MMEFLNHEQASLLLRDKFVVVLGDSIQRSVYKDIVLLLQKDQYLSLGQLKSKGELSFEQDVLVEGGPLHNGTAYREVRQYHSPRHLVRFYFLTRIYSPYVEWILGHFYRGRKPDVVIVNSCLWDISRYNNANWLGEYKVNLDRFFYGLTAVLPQESLVMWTLTMPVSQRIRAGFLPPPVAYRALQLDQDVIRANLFSWELAMAYRLDVLDLYSRFRLNLQQRMADGVHWDHLAHRRITSLILRRAAEAWGFGITGDYFSSDDIYSFGGRHWHGFHGNAGPPCLGPGVFFSFPSAAAVELVSPPLDSSFSSSSSWSTDGTDGMGGGMGDFQSVSTPTRIVSDKCTTTEKITENGPEGAAIEEKGLLKTVPINETSKPEQKPSDGNGAQNAASSKPEQKPSGGNGAQKAAPIKPKPKPACGNGAKKAETHQSHYYDYEGFTEDSVTTNHWFIPGYVSFDGDEQPPPHPPHTPYHRPAHSMAAMHGVRYRPYSLPPHCYDATPASQEGRNQQYQSYVTRNRRTKRR